MEEYVEYVVKDYGYESEWYLDGKLKFREDGPVVEYRGLAHHNRYKPLPIIDYEIKTGEWFKTEEELLEEKKTIKMLDGRIYRLIN